MRSGLVAQALRRHRWSLLAPACTQVLAACVISAMVMTAWSLSPSQLAPQDRAVVVASQMDDVTSVFLGIAVYLSILIVGVTMNLAIQQQLEDVALVRVVGASPGQVRRAVALQVAVVGVLASLIGWLVAIPAGAAWIHALRTHDVLPDAARFAPQIMALPIALGIVLPTSVVGALVASRRTVRIAPSVALTEAGTRCRPVRRSRVIAGSALVVGGAVLSAVLSQIDPAQADDAAFFVMLAECIGVGMLAPLALRRVAGVLRRLARDGVGRLAVDSIEAMTRSLSGALVPLVLAAAFATVKVAVHTTTTRVTGVTEPVADVWTDYSGTVIYATFAGVAALNCLVTVVVNRRRDLAAMQLIGGSRRSLVGMMLVEAVIVSATAVVLAAGVAGVTLAPMLHTTLGRWLPFFPPIVPVAGVLLVTGVVIAGMVAPAATVMRAPPIEVVAAGP
ncbi:MAG TPA: FtsX-like permease family protein [Acidimicrobiales bacterium]|nr:FtsX-like permease family protein [Acidimicrobiales bacterium]